MKVLEWGWRNICSYGNKLQTIEVTEEPTLVLIQGENGAGKSSMSDALTISLYGKSSIRKIKDIPNRVNKNAYTYNKFITSKGDTVEITRGIEPNFYDLKVNGDDYTLPDKRRIDEFVEEELTYIPFNVFSNTISLSVNDFKSFVELSPNDKRKIIDKIFGVDILTDMNRILKEEMKVLRHEIENYNVELASNNTILNQTKEKLKKTKDKNKTALEKRTSEIVKEIEDKTVDLKSEQDKYKDHKQKITEVRDDIKKFREELNKKKFSISELKKKLEIYSKNKCPHCLTDLTDSLHIEIKSKIEKKKELLEKELPDIQSKISELDSVMKDHETKQGEHKDLFYNIKAEISSLEKEVNALKASAKNNEEANSLLEIISSIEKKLEEVDDALIEKESEYSVSEEMEHILSDNGMKRVLMNQIIPILNARILEISKQLEFKFSFEFDAEFNPIIKDLGQKITVSSLSTGERKKMNIIVLLCILELIKMKNNSVNIMFLDEIFSSLDRESAYKVIHILKDFVKEHNMTVFVISHDPLPEEFFDVKIKVTSDEHFSDMEIS